MLKKTLSKSKLSPDTLDKVKMGVMLPERAQTHNQHTRTSLASLLNLVQKTNQVSILDQLCICGSFILG